MLEFIRSQVLDILRVPGEPAIPEGNPGSLRVFRAGKNLYRLLVFFWMITYGLLSTSILIPMVAIGRALARKPLGFQNLFLFGELVVFAIVALIGLITFLALKWNYELRWYMVTDRSLRIRRGVWNLEEMTMTFANIQEIRVTSGPLQLLLGLADVEVLSAGGGSMGSHGTVSGHTARFEGVDNAQQIRDLIAERLKQYRDLGLGDAPSLLKHSNLSEFPESLAGARAVLEEVKKLKGLLTA